LLSNNYKEKSLKIQKKAGQLSPPSLSLARVIRRPNSSIPHSSTYPTPLYNKELLIKMANKSNFFSISLFYL
jgi:hypothetical protein